MKEELVNGEDSAQLEGHLGSFLHDEGGPGLLPDLVRTCSLAASRLWQSRETVCLALGTISQLRHARLTVQRGQRSFQGTTRTKVR